MKKVLHLLLFFPIMVIGQTTTQNYIKTKTYKSETSTSIGNPTLLQATQNITYFDGLGRPIQQIAVGQSSTGKDIITPIEYDNFGRQVKDYLPFADDNQSSLNYRPNALEQVLDYPEYYNNFPYSQKEIELSPLQRVLKRAAPGTSWTLGNGHEIKMEYKTNGINEVKLYTASVAFNTSSDLYETSLVMNSQNSFYPPNQLYKTVTKDENWISGTNNTTEEFKDKAGKVILKRTYDNSLIFDTYYVYDQFGNLSFVIPPAVTNPTTQLDGLCYQYKYDHRNRLVEKKLPGKQWEFIVYDKLNRVVATGPSYSPFGTSTIGWLITKYDAFNRPIYTGWIESAVNATSRKSIQATLNNVATSIISESKTATNNIDGVIINYSNNVTIVAGTLNLLTITYYDDYNFPDAPSPIPTSVLTDNSQPVFYNNSDHQPKGLLTGKWVRAIDQDNFNVFEKSYMLYDNKARVVRLYSSNYIGGHTQVDNKIDFAGKILYTEKTHKLFTDADPITIRNDFTYSPQDRLLTTTQTVNNLPTELISSNSYDELGKLVSKNVGGQDTSGQTYLQKVDYSYNIRGWLTGINDINNLDSDAITDLFAFKINYNQVENENGYAGKELFNGNISETYWRSDTDNIKRKYGYFYDNLNRLTNSVYQKPNATIPVQNSYNEEIDYDKNGNIMRLNRNGNSDNPTTTLEIDRLNYSYEPNTNLLLNVYDGTTDPNGFKDGVNTIDDYRYDDFGNLIRDYNKNIISISYNHLNLPTVIYFDNGNKIKYFYNAEGSKFKKVIEEAGVETTTCYLDIFQYKEYFLKFFSQPEGYVNYTESSGLSLDGSDYVPESYNYVYNYTDHLGNIRVSYSKDPSDNILKIIEENHYYPFGLKQSNYNSDINQYGKDNGVLKIKPISPFLSTINQYKYNSKELQDELGLNWYDYSARNYDPALGRFLTVDPLAETSRKSSTYTYALNNPIFFIDRDGMFADPGDFINEKGKIIGSDGIPDDRLYVIKTTKTSFDSNVKSAGISNSERKTTEKFIKDNSGNTKAFEDNNIAYKNSVEINKNKDARQAMVDEVNKDDGTGGASPENNREHGGRIKNSDGSVVISEPGPVCSPSIKGVACPIYIETRGDQATFHDHPSGTLNDEPKNNSTTYSSTTLGGTSTDRSYLQAPSQDDIDQSSGKIRYVFARGEGNVYLFNNTGVLAIMPQGSFVEAQKK